MRKNKSRLLTIDKNFKPAPMDDGDELYPNGIFMFNITKMIEYLKEHHDEIAPEIISVKASRNVFLKPNEDHINTTDITIPIILAEISPGRYNVIDGNHRIEKAYRSNVESILAYKLSPEQHMPFLTSVKAYHAYIDYWNSKIKDLMRHTKLKEKREYELLQQ
jgi:hypothetical protein